MHFFAELIVKYIKWIAVQLWAKKKNKNKKTAVFSHLESSANYSTQPGSLSSLPVNISSK